MFRENEASRVGAVLAAKAAGDVTGMIQAALQVWLAPEEGEATDDSFATTWAAIAGAGAQAQALAAFVTATRDGSRCRPSAFVRLVEEITESAVLLELAGLVLEAGWDASPYLAVVFARLSAGHARGGPFERFIATRATQLAARPDTWLLVAFTLTTSNVGDRRMVDTWFDDWDARARVPCWLVAAYTATLLQLGGVPRARLLGLAGQVAASAVPDATTAFFDSFLLYDELRAGITTEHIPMIRSRCAAILAFVTAPQVDHPLTRYANQAKHARPIAEADFAFSRPVSGTDVVLGSGALVGALVVGGGLGKSAAQRPPDWRLVEVIQEMLAPCVRIARIAPLFADMLEAERGSARAVELVRAMQKARPAELPALQPHWKKLIAARVPFLKRVAMTFS